MVDATARHGQEALDEMLSLDAGARRAGEFAFGLNEAIQRFTGDGKGATAAGTESCSRPWAIKPAAQLPQVCQEAG